MKAIYNKKQKTVKSTARMMNIAERKIEIVREHGLTTKHLLQYAVVPSLVLFDDERMTAKPAQTSADHRVKDTSPT